MLLHLRPVSTASGPFPWCTCIIIALGFSSQAYGATGEAPAAPKDHLLFMGLDVSAPGPGGNGPIVGLSRAAAQIAVDGEIHTVPIRAMSDVKMVRTPKVSSTVLTLSEPKGNRTYSPTTSPGREVMRQQMDLAFIHDMRMSEAEAGEKQGLVGTTLSGTGAQGRTRDFEAQQEMRAQAAARSSAIQGELRSEGFDPGGVANRASSSGASDLYDAYAVTFTAAAPAIVDDAFAVLIMSVRSPDTPHTPLQTVMFRSLPPLTPEPRKITMEQRGLPRGFAVDRVTVHVYAHGRELASNLSEQTVAVTRDEAHQFLLIRYTLDHKLASLPAAPIPDLLPADAGDRVPATERERTIELHVNSEGRVEDFTLDPALAPGVAHDVGNLVRNALFFPALQNGEPVAGPTTLTVGDFVRAPVAATSGAGR